MWAGLIAAAACSTVGTIACVESSSQTYGSSGSATGASTGTTSSTFDKHALLGAITATTRSELTAFAADTESLATATENLAGSPGSDNLAAAQAAWRTAMKRWQRLEVMQFGPAAGSSITGGKGLRDTIYSWPNTNRCAVDQQLVKSDHGDAQALAMKLVNVRGLGAIEHLLFHSESSNACSAVNELNTSGTWDSVTGELPQRRANYSAAAAALLATSAAELRDAWDPSVGNFAGELSTPGATFGGDVAKALDVVGYAFGYLDTKTKDLKLAIPAGLASCANPTCPDALELAESKFSKAAIRENLVAYQRLFHGGEPFDDAALGFDDWLQALGANELKAELAASIAASLAAVDAIEEDDLSESLALDPKSVEDVYFALKKTTDLFKSQFVTVLDLHLPNDAPTDND